MKNILIASRNPVKVQATLNGFQRMFPEESFQIQSAPAASGVSDQPRSDEETLRGATNRAQSAARDYPQANYWVGIEGGVQETDGQMTAFAWVVIYDGRSMGKSRTGAFFLPPQVSRLVRQGVELGTADDIVFQRENSKQENGAIGILSANVVDRTSLYEQAVILALLPFKNPDLYSESPKIRKEQIQMSEKAFQDYYPDDVAHCYGCGRLNEHGHQIKSYWDGDETVSTFLPKPYHTAIPGYVYGGLIASLIDCHSTGTAAAAAYRAAGRSMDTLPALRYLTASLHVDYLRPTPLGVPLHLRASIKEIKGKKVVVSSTVSANGQVCARGEVVAVRMPENLIPNSLK